MTERREWVSALVLAWVLVLTRSAVFVVYEQSHFDSDQAIVGLMAKHLVEGRAFPLFFYGQSYMMAVEAWVSAPFLRIGGPTVASLHAAIIALNLIVVTLLITILWKTAGVRPWHALVASLFFAAAPPYTSALLIEAQGGSIEPFIYIALLWWLRDRPMWFGAVLGFGFLNREFTIYAVPVIVLGQLVTRQFWRREVLRGWVVAAVAFFAAWEALTSLKPFADLMGPGTRWQLLRGFAGSPSADVASRTDASVIDWPARVVTAIGRLFTELMNGRPMDLGVPQGHIWLAWPVLLALAATMGRLVWLVRRDGMPAAARAGFCWYLFGVGSVTLAAYSLARIPTDGTLRYLLLTLLAPIGLVAGLLTIETSRAVRRATMVWAIAWAAVAMTDNVSVIRSYRAGEVPNEIRAVADALDASGVRVAEADYSRAYKLSFLTNERVKIASTDVARISEYQDLAVAAGDRLRRLQANSCAGGTPVATYFLCPTRR